MPVRVSSHEVVPIDRSSSAPLPANIPQSRLKAMLERWPSHTWVHVVGHSNLSVQRLSRFAFLERRKQAYRFRMLEDGVVVGHFTTADEVTAALRDPKSLLHSDGLLGKWALVAPPEFHTLLHRASPHPTLHRPSSAPATNTPAAEKPPSSGSFNTLRSMTPAEEAQIRHPIPAPPEVPDIWVTPETPSTNDPALAFSHLTIAPSRTQSAGPSLSRSAFPRWKAQRLRPNPHQEPAVVREACTAWHYSEDTAQWTFREVTAKLAAEPFAEGAMRIVHKAILEQGRWQSQYVAKLYNRCAEMELVAPTADMFAGMNPDAMVDKAWMERTLLNQVGAGLELAIAQRILPEGKTMSIQEFLTWNRRLNMLRKDVEMQGVCVSLAREFNLQAEGPRVKFLETHLLVCEERPQQTIFTCEPMVGADCREPDAGERAAEEAFSHWTYVRSKGKYLILHFQRVGDVFVNSQVYSTEQRFGVGDYGREGIEEFFASHRCGVACESLGLRPSPSGEAGTRR